jgi:hypothetical protein
MSWHRPPASIPSQRRHRYTDTQAAGQSVTVAAHPPFTHPPRHCALPPTQRIGVNCHAFDVEWIRSGAATVPLLVVMMRPSPHHHHYHGEFAHERCAEIAIDRALLSCLIAGLCVQRFQN